MGSSNPLDLSLRDIRGPMIDLLDKLHSNMGNVYLEELKKLLRQEPCWAEGMIYIPLEWSPDFCQCPGLNIDSMKIIYNTGNGEGWRLPSYSEVRRYIQKKELGFKTETFYWTSESEEVAPPGRLRTIKVYENYENCCCSSFYKDLRVKGIDFPHLRLCRPMKIQGH